MEKQSKTAQRPPMKGDDAPRGGRVRTTRPGPMSRNAPLAGIVVTLVLLVVAAVLAPRQAPHPDMLRPVANWDLGNPAWWAYPLERNAFKRDLIRGNLRDVHRLPGTQLLWAVGESGLILHSEDAGLHWTQQHPEPPPRPANVSFSLISSAQAAIAPDKSAYPLNKSPMQQQAADAQQVDPQGAVPQAVDVPRRPPSKGVAPVQAPAPPRPALPESPRIAPEKADLNAVFFIDADQGWAVGNGGAVLMTKDGGRNWSVVDAGASNDFGGVVFSADGKRGWIFPASTARGAAATRVSENGGRTWTESSLGSLGMLDAKPALGADRAIAFRGTARGLMSNGGKDIWFIENSASGAALSVERAPSKDTTQLVQWSDFRPQALQVSSDSQRLVLVGNNGKIRYSTDLGKTWRNVDSGRRADLMAVQCDDSLDDCLAVGDGGTVLRGRGLASWRAMTPGGGANLLWARFKDNGEDGDAVSSANIQFVTDDGGISWSSVGETKLPASEVKSPFGFMDGNFRWRVGIGKAERSDDGGKNWRSAAPSTQAWLLSAFFLADHQRGWISGADGNIFATRDGGNSWQQQSTQTRSWLWHISMDANGKTGRALGAYGTVLLTDDGGVRWRESALYKRYPAPWFWLLLILGGIALIVLVPRHMRSRNQEQDVVEGPAASLSSDQPVTHIENDRLGYRPAIEALAAFLSNEATEPRITLAISGEWGSGKSSMMRMLQTEMASKGYRTAWFNAWHHQQEGRQLTALFNVVRRQGVPTFFRQPVAALRVRSKLIWGRSAFYRFVCIAIPLVVLVAVGDFSRQPDRWERFKWWIAHQTLQWERVVITDKSIEKLKAVDAKPAAAQSAPKAEPSSVPSSPAAPARAQIRPEVLTYMRNALVWQSDQEESQPRHCGDTRNIADADRCVFKQPEQLLVTIEKGTGLTLWPSEREAILKAAEPIPVPPLFPALEHFIVPLLGLLGILFTKGMTVYGLEVLRPLRNIFGTAPTADGGKEATGAIEHYRREYCLLTEALDGRLVIFVDDIDRCNADTVNGIMELTNYLVDVGRCFVVLGMAMERVKASIRAPAGNSATNAESDYADKYLRKLVHIELPVPIANAQESLGLFIQRAEAKSRAAAQKEAERRMLAQWWSMLRPWLVRVIVVAGVIGAATAAVSMGRLLNNYRLPAALKIAPVENGSASLLPPGSDSASRPLATPAAPNGAGNAPSAGGDVGLGVSSPTVWPWRELALVVTILLVLLAVGSSRVLQERVTLALGGALRTRDSEEFREALQIWLDAVRMHDETPRGIKRFCNRARLFAIYEKEDVEALQHEGQTIEPTRDVHVVALAAIHHVSPDALKQLLLPLGPDIMTEGGKVTGTGSELGRFIEAHRQRFGWPEVDAIGRFIERVQRIAVR
ncbi:P-loop NTPase fold protein [Uliginosibacterium sp. H3]|uniref:P-loop NTPase fold protein n=1 Tax=Uliginosibacterium silvisoli TaxID=3114758 RepID=A0ABU6JZZ5_9RHOO|nr:P-loop NTPase fold protein [Uliginosibacterium sp. H3]